MQPDDSSSSGSPGTATGPSTFHYGWDIIETVRPNASQRAAIRTTAAKQLRCSSLKSTWDKRPQRVTAGV